MVSDPAIATAADYADALLTARRAKNLVLLLVLLMLLIQLALFFTAKYTNVIVTNTSEVIATTNPSDAKWTDALHYVIGLSDFAGMALAIVLSMTLCLIVKIMLVGRLIGVARVTSALIWSFVILVLLFPWQAFLSYHQFNSRAFMPPGVLYTWDELLRSAKLGKDSNTEVKATELVLHWARFVVFPCIAVILLLAVQIKSNRGLRQALGEDTLSDETVTTSM